MSIYEGDWRDTATGAPFCPRGFARSLPCGPKSAQLRRTGRRVTKAKSKFNRTINLAEKLWEIYLTSDDKDMWGWIGSSGCMARGHAYGDWSHTSSWGAFITFVFAELWYKSTSSVRGPHAEGHRPDTLLITDAFSGSQMLRWAIHMDEYNSGIDYGRAFIYQINPNKQVEYYPYYQTRLIDCTGTEGWEEGTHTFNAPAAWPFESGDDVYGYCRWRGGLNYRRSSINMVEAE